MNPKEIPHSASRDVQGLLGQCALATVAILGTLATLGASQNAGRSQHLRYRSEAACPVGVAKLTSMGMIYGFNEGSIRCLGTYYFCQ